LFRTKRKQIVLALGHGGGKGASTALVPIGADLGPIRHKKRAPRGQKGVVEKDAFHLSHCEKMGGNLDFLGDCTTPDLRQKGKEGGVTLNEYYISYRKKKVKERGCAAREG